MKSITLEFKEFYCDGVSDVSLRGGGRAAIDMRPFRVKHLKEIRESINDNGFGGESINGAIVGVYREYDNGARVYARMITLGDVSEVIRQIIAKTD